MGTRAASNEIIFTQGNFLATEQSARPGDPGPRILPDPPAGGEIAYTRAGSFHLDRDGNMVTSDGDLLEPQITIPPDAQSITIAPDGTVSYHAAGADRRADRRADPTGELPESGRLEQPGTQSVPADRRLRRPDGRQSRAARKGLGTLLQGYTEQSNVSVVEEFINLIVSQRAYEANSKVVKAADEMYQQVNNITR